MSKRMFKTPELMPVADARKSIGNGLKVKEIDLKMVEVQYPRDDGESFFIGGHAAGKEHVKYVCTRAGLSVQTAMRMSPKLRTSAFGELSAGNARLLLGQDGKVVHILGEEGVYVSYPKVFDAIVDATKATHVEVVRDRSSFMNFVTSDSIPAKKDDIMRSGISLEASYGDGTQTFAMGPFCYRLVCTNGMIGYEDNLLDFASTKEDDVLAFIAQQSIAMLELSRKNMIPHMISLQGQKVNDAVSFLHGYLGEVSVGNKVRQAIEDEAQSVSDPTAWDLLNIVTSHANRVKPSHRRRLQKLGGLMVSAETSACRCPQCHRDLTTAPKPTIKS